MKKVIKKYKHELLLLLIIPMWMGLANHWYIWYGQEDNLVWIKSIYKLLDGNFWANSSICLIIGYLAYLSYCKISKDNDIRPYRLALTIIVLLLLWYESNVVYAQTGFGLDYKILLTIILCFLLLIMVIKICRKVVICYKSGGKEEKNIIGFSTDNVDTNNVEDDIKKYVSYITEKLLATNINDRAFAIGITGEWGTGKTTFLQLIKESIKDKAYVVDFNPWMCKTPEQVTQDFFSSLREQLSPLHSTLSKSIKEYSNLLSDLTVPTLSAFGINAKLLVKEESLQEKKKSLSEKFSCLPKPVVVFIDDIDRLERKEVFEVLRLIRNTADLSNTIYVVAYDKEYVVNILEEGKIKNASLYLEKIFQLEISLPKIDSEQIWYCLERELENQDISKESTISLFKDKKEKYLILRVINKYRSVKRFVNLYIQNLGCLNDIFADSINAKDLFWLELLHMYDTKTYNDLANNRHNLLYINNEKYVIKNGILPWAKKLKENSYEGEEFWKKETPEILRMMFGEYTEKKENSISHIVNYDKYFTISFSEFELLLAERDKLLEENSNPEEIVTEWMDNKNLYSIFFRLSQVKVNECNEKQLKKFIQGVLHFALKVPEEYTSEFIKIRKTLMETEYCNDKKDIASKEIISWKRISY